MSRTTSLLYPLLLSLAIILITFCPSSSCFETHTQTQILSHLKNIESTIEANLKSHVIFDVLATCLSEAKILGEKLVGQSQLCEQLNAQLAQKESQRVSAQSELATLLQLLPAEIKKGQDLAEKQKKALNAQLALIELLKAKVEQLRQKRPDKAQSCQNMIILLNKLAEKLQKELAAVRPVTEQLVQLQADVSSLRSTIAQLTTTIDAMRKEWDACRKQSDTSSDALAQKEKECNKANVQADAIREKLRQEQGNVQLVERLIANYSRDPLSVIDTVNDPTFSTVHPGAQEPVIDQTWVQINTTLEGMIKHYSELDTQADSQYDNAKKALESKCDKEKKRLEGSIDTKEGIVETYQIELDDKRDELPQVQQKVASLKQNKTVSEGMLVEVTQTCLRYKKESEGDDTLQREIDAIQLIIEFVEHTYEEKHITNITNTRLVTKFKEIKARLEALLKASMEKATKDYKECTEKRAQLQADIAKVGGDLQQQEAKLGALQQRMAFLLQQLSLLIKEVADLKKSLADHLAQCQKLLMQLESDRKDYSNTVQALAVIQKLVVHIATN
eukprot:CAMPEP_0117441576 /NCGR_PEP_ID=MMETSP0759-20121206/3705_1 /TAXON_ID=63605 /ORGANISM="Percolomonas cosmopolitus, Strain WS" /LENGTH=559 /DNA_ID=CAMNT_0005233433 /DNA_START=40 /DNA_END=1719 /DNA_ORIENTATION=-